MIAVALFAYFVLYMGRKILCDFFAGIGTVCVSSMVSFVEELCEFLAVMHGCIGNCIVLNQLAVGICFYMVFIAIVGFLILLCPPGIRVLLTQLVDIFRLLPFFRNIARFDFLGKYRTL